MENTVTISTKPIWEGIVKIDNTFDDYVTDIKDLSNKKELIIKDVKYHHVDASTPDGLIIHYNYPREVRIWIVNKEIHDYMKCSVLLGYHKVEKEKGLIRKQKYYEEHLAVKGFGLEPCPAPQENVPCLASYRANIGGDNTFNIERHGIKAFYTASQSSQDNPARRSITCVFVVSDNQPFVAHVRKKGKIYKMVCNSSGIREELQDIGEEPQTLKKKTNDPLAILKLRLAKGEITKEEYDDLKKVLE